MKKLTQDEFIEKATSVHGDKYDYSTVRYTNAITKVLIICKIHGEFFQSPNSHLSGCGCFLCNKIKQSMNIYEFIKKAVKIHGNKYDYSGVQYVNVATKIYVVCRIHGGFYQTPSSHLCGHGCPECGRLQNISKQMHGNKENFIKKSIFMHGERYDYSKVNYVNIKTKVCIICKIHGEFLQDFNNHLKGRGCPVCGKLSRSIKNTLDKNEFITKAVLIHGYKYDYSKVEYISTKDKICVICKIHGDFLQAPCQHLRGSGCPACSKLNASSIIRLTKEEFIMKSKISHGINMYDYSKVEYKDLKTKIYIICKIHGSFYQRPSDHLLGCGCPKCALDKKRLSTEEFIKRAIAIHGKDKYDYSNIKYVDSSTKICFTCKLHGNFYQKPINHLKGYGCPTCTKISITERSTSTKQKFIERAIKIHGEGKYDYSKVKYINNHVKICIICKIHGEFYQKPNNHLSGHGCENCTIISSGEKFIKKWLVSNNVEYKQQQTYSNLRGFNNKKLLKFDFYVPIKNLLVEFDGSSIIDQYNLKVCLKKKLLISLKERNIMMLLKISIV